MKPFFVPPGDADFAGVTLPLSASEQRSYPDFIAFRLVSYATVFALNVR